MTETLKDVVMDVGKPVIGVSIAKAVDLPKKLDFGDSFPLTHGANGVLYALVGDVINFATGEQASNIATMNVYGLVDSVTFFSATSAVADDLGKQGGLSRNNAEIFAESAIVSAGRIGSRMIDESPMAPDWLRIVRHPTSLIRQ